MNTSAPAYGLWLLVILNSAVFIIFAFSFFKPQTKRDWRSFAAPDMPRNLNSYQSAGCVADNMRRLRMQHDHSGTHGSDRQRTISRYVFFGFLAVAAYFLITEHRAHLFGILPFLLLAACPLMHVFHHRGHNHDGGESPPSQRGGSGAPNDPEGGGHRH